MTSNVLENLSKMVRKSPQNTSKIDLEEGVWRPLGSHPCAEVTPRHHFGRFWLHLGTLFGDQFWLILGIVFWCFFDMSSGWHFWRFGVHLGPILGALGGTFLEACLNLYVNRDMHEHSSI